MSLKTLLNRVRLSTAAWGPALLRAYYTGVMPYWRSVAARKRAAFCTTYVAVTGSCGKTTTTMLASTLLGAQRSVRTSNAHNTERNILRAIRHLDGPIDAFVQEVSEFPPGTLARTAATLHPDVAIITSIGLDHLNKFRTREAVAAEIATLTGAIGDKGTLCLNADDDLARGLAAGARARVLLFGRAADADVRAENVHSLLPERLGFDLVIGERRWPVRTRFAGTLMLTNILGALAAVHALGLDIGRAVADLATIEPLRNRMNVVEVPGGHTFLMDTIKAPTWATQMLVADLPNIWSGRRIFVLGELSDKGNNAAAKYRRVLRAAAAQADLVLGVSHAESAARRVCRSDSTLPIEGVAGFDALEALLAAQPPSLVVLKGNSLKLGTMIERLVAAGTKGLAT
jgi:UDP-N-acetylmuramoyl-tripeptide--D-alanyl-D-alanine ligase